MRAVQSIWFKQNSHQIDYSCGWLSSAFNLMSWVLSSHQLAKFFTHIELVTDVIGAELATKLELPYSSIRIDLENKKQENFLWVSNKLYTYSIQQYPFIHVDSDVYIFNEIPLHLLKAPLIAQNFEYDLDSYVHAYKDILAHCSYIPSQIKKDAAGRLTAVNAGIIGGTDTVFFKEYCSFVNDFLQNNKLALLKCNYAYLNEFVEQFLFAQFAVFKSIPIDYMSSKEFGPPCDYQMAEFAKLPFDCNYIHVVNYKSNPDICEQLAQRLFIESSELYERVQKVNRQLNSIQYVIPLMESGPKQDHFYRTRQLLRFLDLLNNDLHLSQQQLADAVEILPESLTKNVISDVFKFETRRQIYAEFLLSHKQDWKSYSIEANDILSLPVTDYVKIQFKLSNLCIRLDTEWDWSEVNEFSTQTDDRDLLTNLRKESSYFELLLLFYPCHQFIRELQLDILNILILDEFEKISTIYDVIESIRHNIIIYQPKINLEELAHTILSRIRYFLYHGILEPSYYSII